MLNRIHYFGKEDITTPYYMSKLDDRVEVLRWILILS